MTCSHFFGHPNQHTMKHTIFLIDVKLMSWFWFIRVHIFISPHITVFTWPVCRFMISYTYCTDILISFSLSLSLSLSSSLSLPPLLSLSLPPSLSLSNFSTQDSSLFILFKGFESIYIWTCFINSVHPYIKCAGAQIWNIKHSKVWLTCGHLDLIAQICLSFTCS